MESSPEPDPTLLPPGTRLLHIGPPKTATTTLQAALYAARPALLEQGVRHAGRNRNAASAASAVLGRQSQFIGGAVPSMRRWRALAGEVKGARESRVVVSSEFFADAPADSIPRIVHDLGPQPLHVVVTLRPLAKLLPSQWQQFIQDGLTTPFDEWLEVMFSMRPGRRRTGFWHRHRHHELVARWAEVVGAGNVTVIALDERDPAMVLRAFERLTGLRDGTLLLQRDLANRSMTVAEVEAVRAFNLAFKASGLPQALLSKVMHFGAGRYMKRLEPEPGAARIELPAWAIAPTGAVSREIVGGIAASGVRVIGDLETLAWVPAAGPVRHDAVPVVVSPRVAASMAIGVLASTGQARSRGTRVDPASPSIARIPTYVLTGVVAGRVRTAAVSRSLALLRQGRGLTGADAE